MPNTFAYIALFSWPIVVFPLFCILTRSQALVVSILGGYLLLPHGVGINLPVLPTFDKVLVPALSAGIMCLVTADRAEAKAPRSARGGKRQGWPRARRIEVALLLLLVLTPFLTVMGNAAPYLAGPRVIPGLKLYDAFSMILGALVSILPFLLARRYLSRPEHHVLLLRGLCVAGLLYSLPTLFEVRMSPQLSNWIYGFLSQSFGQAMRGEGFRPVVFLQHGLWLAIFLAMALLAAFALWRQERPGGKWLLAGLWLLGTLMLCRSLGAQAIALLFAPIILFLPVRWQMIAAASVALVILLYPMLRSAGLVPVGRIVALAEMIDPQRAGSLEFRIRNEDILLAHANAKPLVGWGTWGRSRVFDEQTGEDKSTTDGAWVIIVGGNGWLGYIPRFGLLTLPIFLLMLRWREFKVSPATSGLCLVLAANLLDMIPNATLTPITWIIAGSLMGYAAIASRAVRSPRKARSTHPYSRRAAPEAVRSHET